MDDVAGGVDSRPARLGDEPLPATPAWPLAQRSDDRLGKAGSDHRIGIEQDDQLAAGGGRTGVAGRREAAVGSLAEQPGVRRQLGDDRDRIVTRVVVDDDQLVGWTELVSDRRDRAADLVRGLVGDDDDRDRARALSAGRSRPGGVGGGHGGGVGGPGGLGGWLIGAHGAAIIGQARTTLTWCGAR